MSQADFNIDNISRSLFRAETNASLQALATLSSGATEPTTTYAYQLWADTTSGILKQRDSGNSFWIDKGNLNDINWGFLDASGATMSGLFNFNEATDIASASNVDLTSATGNVLVITGTTAVDAFTMNQGQVMFIKAEGALPLNYNATTMNINGGASYTCTAGDRLIVWKDIDNIIQVNVISQVGGLKLINRRIITASEGPTAYTTGAKKALVRICGGGGGGGGSDTTDNRHGGGGAAGGYCEKLFTITASTYDVTIGAAGAAGTTTSSGGAGGNTVFTDGVETLTANGGAGGLIGTTATNTRATGGTATGGDLNIQGGYGGSSLIGTVYTQGDGADTLFGFGGRTAYGLAGLEGTGYGAGGAGGSRGTTTSRAGAIGRAGLVILEEYA